MVRVFRYWFSLSFVVQIFVDAMAASVGALLAVQLNGVSGADHRVVAAALLASCFVLCLNSGLGFYRRTRVRNNSRVVLQAAFSLLLASTLVFLMLWALSYFTYHQGIVALPALLGVTGFLALRSGAAQRKATPLFEHRILVFGVGSRAWSIQTAAEQSNVSVRVVGFYPSGSQEPQVVPSEFVLPVGKGLMQAALDLKVDEIVIAVNERRGGALPLQQLLECRVMGVQVHDLATHFERMLGQIRLDSIQAGWLIFGDGFEQGLFRRICKRVFDLVFACVLLVLAAPLMLLTMILIALESGFPVFYLQERTGLDGRRFKVIKFRSMRTDAEKDGTPKWAVGNDDRSTRVGRIIRKFRIDETPQLINVLKGEMSLVGPRPERPFFVQQLSLELPYYGLRHSVKPGLSGWAQVSYGYGASVEDAAEKLQYDLFYVKNNTLFLDFMILFKTIGVVIKGHGAH